MTARTSWDVCCSAASSWILISGHAGSPDLLASGWGDREGPGEGGRREPPHWPRGGTRETGMDGWSALVGAPQPRQVPPPGNPTLTPFFTPSPPSCAKTLPEAISPPSHPIILGSMMTPPRHTHHLGHETWSPPSVPSPDPSGHKHGPAWRGSGSSLVPGELPPLVVLTLSSSHVL